MIQGQVVDIEPTPKLNEGLYKTKQALKTVEKNKEGHYGRYADLNAIEKAIYYAINSENTGIDFYQGITEQETAKGVIHKIYTVITHISGESRIIWGDTYDYNSNMQKKGADETYAKRRSLEMAFGISASDEDDDNDEASLLEQYQSKEEVFRKNGVAKIKTAFNNIKSDRYDLLFATVGISKGKISMIEKLDYTSVLILWGAVQHEELMNSKTLG